MAIPVYRPSHITTISRIPIIPDIIRAVLIWDGAVIQGTIIITSIGIGTTIDQVIITNTIMAIDEDINRVAMVDTIGTITGRATVEANGFDKLNARNGGQMGRVN